MMHSKHSDTCGFHLKDVEMEELEYRLVGGWGAGIEEILKIFLHCTRDEVIRAMRRVESFCFMADDDATGTIDNEEYAVLLIRRGV